MDTTTLLVAAGALAALQFNLIWVAEGRRRDGYRPSYHPISALSLGPAGWLQTASFVAAGSLVVVFAAGVHTAGSSRAVPVLLAVAGLGLIGAGVWSMDPMRGYPPEAIDWDPEQNSPQHRLHDAASLVVFLAIPAAAAISAINGGGWWRWYSAATAIGGLGLVAWFGFAYERDTQRSGLLQRGMVLVIWAWIAVLSVRLL